VASAAVDVYAALVEEASLLNALHATVPRGNTGDAAAAQARRSALQGREAVREFLEEGSRRFLSAAEARGVAPLPHGSQEAVAVADGDVPEGPADEGFLNLVTGNDPRYGSALLVDIKGYVDYQGDIDHAAQPYVAGNGYEVFVFGR
jgi:hypothetical protein